MEPYLSSNNFEVRRTMSRFRLSAHDLAVEKGRQQSVPRNNRLCKICNVIEDKEHFLKGEIRGKLNAQITQNNL